MSAFLDVQQVSSGYGLGSVLQDLSLHVESGEVVAVVGANGAGKTTLLRTVAGLLTPTRGQILFDGPCSPCLGSAAPSWPARCRVANARCAPSRAL